MPQGLEITPRLRHVRGMALKYLATTFTPAVRAAQTHYYGRSPQLLPAPERDTLTAEEIDFIAARDSFYMATVTEDGWPYIQHRGGPPGFELCGRSTASSANGLRLLPGQAILNTARGFALVEVLASCHEKTRDVAIHLHR